MGATAASSEGSSSQSPRNMLPHKLPELPTGEIIAEVWCGSEYTVVSSESGNLWSCGWNEHGNLGIGASVDISSFWKPVVFTSRSSASPHVTTMQEFFQADVSRTDMSSSAKALEVNTDGPMTPDQCQLLAIWDGSLCCGGGHCVALLKKPTY